MHKYILIPLVALLCSCALLQNQALTEALVAAAVSQGLAHTPDAQRALVAKDIDIASGLYNALVGPDGIPSPAQFAAGLDKYLPNDNAKPLAQAALNPLYAVYYSQIAAKAPKDQIAYFGNVILAGFKAGAAPYVK